MLLVGHENANDRMTATFNPFQPLRWSRFLLEQMLQVKHHVPTEYRVTTVANEKGYWCRMKLDTDVQEGESAPQKKSCNFCSGLRRKMGPAEVFPLLRKHAKLAQTWLIENLKGKTP